MSSLYLMLLPWCPKVVYSMGYDSPSIESKKNLEQRILKSGASWDPAGLPINKPGHNKSADQAQAPYFSSFSIFSSNKEKS